MYKYLTKYFTIIISLFGHRIVRPGYSAMALSAGIVAAVALVMVVAVVGTVQGQGQ